ncbi:GDP-L-galactose phosphorylase 1-like isoform X4 [Triticum dicoccoides]|uniref:GDP-L-galactose phosphorylase 1-like isoform X4 n=1 Tax=Triticum dicoccoides TaxID=85692 RepID=UPI00188E7215|nr:GDP-L-galactose phosphorylase 1-like isoform X4 [Triticum dicoccoides]XP_037415062.1 GDP-L-galactose phosphorylase 1-like isoform X4 [Triticum dicoccoides]XP_044351189.1 GDP-L-galactose phosphorylase 1-like isoform X5 [Triticum aestivum]XP_044351190.1 GDP-L-galactose phosphorylase 1-like isoform X5 [Triticum aestivum]XP_044351191.1 GDP-L-galactose phosphorylase 1-like isoform X5 [Triticum aestivum]
MKLFETKAGMCSNGFDSTNCLRMEEVEPNLSPFLHKLFKEWDDRNARGLFHHDITTSEAKVLPGEHNFVATLIEGRDQKKRPTEFGMNQVLQPFHSEKFNFTKVKPEEVIFRFQETENDSAQYFDGTPPTVSASPSCILINVSPIGYCHVLLTPQIQECLPQRVDQESFLLAMYVAREARNPFFRVGYNSLGAFATINHLHFQAYYLKVQYPVENAPTERITVVRNGVSISQLVRYPVSGFVFEGGASLEDLSQAVSDACIFLQENNRPFNVLISESGKRVFLLLQCYAEKQASGKASQEFLDMRINPAVWELSGHLVLKRRKDYDEASEATLCRFLVEASLSEAEFQELKRCLLEFLATASPEK